MIVNLLIVIEQKSKWKLTMSNNYFNTLTLRDQLEQLGKCRFMHLNEFTEGVDALKGKKIVVIGCGAQGLNQGLNMRDSGLNISYARLLFNGHNHFGYRVQPTMNATINITNTCR